MSLRPSSWSSFVQVSSLNGVFECRLGEAFEAGLNFKSGGSPLSLTGWTFSVNFIDATANIDESDNINTSTPSILNRISNIVLLENNPQTNAGLVVTSINAAAGTAILTIPAVVLGAPATSAPIDATNTLLKLFQITATFAGQAASFNNTRKIALAAIVRWAL